MLKQLEPLIYAAIFFSMPVALVYGIQAAPSYGVSMPMASIPAALIAFAFSWHVSARLARGKWW